MKRKPILVDEKLVKRLFGAFFMRASMGQQFIILRDGQPYCQLVGMPPEKRQRAYA